MGEASSATGSGRPWWLPVVLVDAWLVAVTSVNRHLPALEGVPLLDQPGGWLPLEPFNLVRENNLAAWWSTAALALAGLLCWELAGRSARPGRGTWALLGAVFLGLSADEAASLHERVSLPGGWIPGAALGVVLVAPALWRLHAEPATRRAARRIVAGLTLFAAVAGMEFVERRMELPDGLRGLRAGLEEGLELAGQLLLLLAVVERRRPDDHAAHRGVLDVCPDASRLPGLPVVAAGLVAVHIAASILWVPGLADFAARGDPSSWVPALLLLLAGCSAARARRSGHAVGGLAALGLLAASAEQIGRPARHVAGLWSAVPEQAVSGTATLFGALLLLAAGAGLSGGGRTLLWVAGAVHGAAAWWLSGAAEAVVVGVTAAAAVAAVSRTSPGGPARDA